MTMVKTVSGFKPGSPEEKRHDELVAEVRAAAEKEGLTEAQVTYACQTASGYCLSHGKDSAKPSIEGIILGAKRRA